MELVMITVNTVNK